MPEQVRLLPSLQSTLQLKVGRVNGEALNILVELISSGLQVGLA